MAEAKKEEKKPMGIHEKLMIVQQKLKAPKNQKNSFGNYNYRSCEDILEGVKPLLVEVRAVLTLEDDIVLIGDRFYVQATAKFIDADDPHDVITNVAYAREATMKKGSDESQVTGASSSYARKYALNGLLVIDDTKDNDTNELKNERDARAEKQTEKQERPTKAPHRKDTPEEARLNDEMRASVDPDLLPDPKRTPEYRAEKIRAKIAEKGQDEAKLMENAKVKDWLELTDAKFVSLMGWLERK